MRQWRAKCWSGVCPSGVDEAIVERVGPFPSPSVLIDGTDVMRPDQPPKDVSVGQVCLRAR